MHTGITLQKLRLFRLVVEKGSLNQAAEQIGMSQSAVSQHIRGLEAAVGVPLLIRSSVGVKPTAEGGVLLEGVVEVLARLDSALENMHTLADAESMRVRIGATPGVSTFILPEWISRFQATHSEASVSTTTGFTKEIVAGVLSSELDFGITVGEIADLDAPNLVQEVLGSEAYVLVVPPDHRWVNQPVVSLKELKQEPFLARHGKSRSRKWLEGILGSGLRISAEIDSPSTIKNALMSGMGISILPYYSVKRDIERGSLAICRIENLTLSRPLLIFWNGQASFSKMMSHFFDQISS